MDIVTPDLLRAFPLPSVNGGKEDRGRVLLIGGGRQVAGAIRLAGEAVLRSGAGKLQIAAPVGVCAGLGLHIPESRVFGVAETAEGEMSPDALEALLPRAGLCDAVLIGPGMVDVEAAGQLTRGLLDRLNGPTFLLDAGAMMGLWDRGDLLKRHDGRIVITPHAGEMAGMCGLDQAEIERDPAQAAVRAADRLGAVVALKGRDTYIATLDGQVFRHAAVAEGLGTAGSGDVLAGVISGLLAQGAAPLAATLWGVAAHARAGARLGPPGFLARQLAGEVPAVLAELLPHR